VAQRRAGWLAKWQASEPTLHTAELANEALLWLRLFDALSLWLCSACPGGGECVEQWPESFTIGAGEPLETVIGPLVSTDGEYPANAESCKVAVDPWPFDAEELALKVTGNVAPVQKYRDAAELATERRPCEVRWLLIPAE
jgi:hypothetical protein